MKKRSVIISKRAKKDIQDFYYCICYLYKQPLTAYRNQIEMYQTIRNLSYRADSTARNEYVQEMFGMDARHIIFKKMAIIYFIDGDYVYIQRIIPSSLIY
jgi:hypothetical protein